MSSEKTHCCPICSKAMPASVSDWNFYCVNCDYWAADLKYDIASESDEIFDSSRNDGEVIGFLDAIRIQNFNILLDRIREILGNKPLRILDVGCATGLFIQVATARGHSVLGLEPNPKMAAAAKGKGFDVIGGYFPDAITDDHCFDLIIFNDVFEHIPELSGIVAGVKRKLREKGLLVINLPNSDGLLFVFGRILFGLGITKLWDRLWQKMFYTPHLHYFNKKSLDKYLSKHGLSPCSSSIELSVMSISGLWARVSVDRSASFAKKIAMYVSALSVYPFLQFFPKDTFAAFYKKN